MSRLFPVPASRFQKFLKNIGFELKRQKGSHQIWAHIDGCSTVLPVHPGVDLGKGLIKTIINEIDVELEDYLKSI